MTDKYERIVAMMTDDNINALAEITAKAAARRGQISRAALESLLAGGYERVEATGPLTLDGREVLTVAGVAVALRSDVHAERLAAAFEAARRSKQKAEKQPEVRESIASVACPQMIEGKPCGGALNRGGVCPACVTGRMGYRYRYTCESCGCDIVTKEELK